MLRKQLWKSILTLSNAWMCTWDVQQCWHDMNRSARTLSLIPHASCLTQALEQEQECSKELSSACLKLHHSIVKVTPGAHALRAAGSHGRVSAHLLLRADRS